ncbi:hypothetical protein SAM23877_6078 [Streptomyces ambofaciens ATCC 23877]|uniref:Uncharacterized protein n=1 Tax=Streptomyces ambofaciens (strain ATCC 23877 / 3486 / DSM 40053 / JCM 4204 / NBRC 12836 / NRRL B-2516) TaxID=278992 RepID=A0A0K2B1P2_STRA7|nr:hypothetical protein SAM23877_6078 [Streptomyces ambofaciens ATCC 23877]
MTAISLSRSRCRICGSRFLDIRHGGIPSEHCSQECKRVSTRIRQRRFRAGGSTCT